MGCTKTNVIVLDFDGVINKYPGWEGEGFHVIRGGPVPGAKEAIEALRRSGRTVLISSVRCGHEGGEIAIWEYLKKHGIVVDGVCRRKPPADFYVDDKAIQFKGNWDQLLYDIVNFKHWEDE